MIRFYLRDIIDDHKDGWKMQLTTLLLTFNFTINKVTFVSVKDSNESSIIHIHSDNLLIFIGYKTNNIINELFKSLLGEYQESLKTKIKKSDFVFDSVDAL